MSRDWIRPESVRLDLDESRSYARRGDVLSMLDYLIKARMKANFLYGIGCISGDVCEAFLETEKLGYENGIILKLGNARYRAKVGERELMEGDICFAEVCAEILGVDISSRVNEVRFS